MSIVSSIIKNPSRKPFNFHFFLIHFHCHKSSPSKFLFLQSRQIRHHKNLACFFTFFIMRFCFRNPLFYAVIGKYAITKILQNLYKEEKFPHLPPFTNSQNQKGGKVLVSFAFSKKDVVYLELMVWDHIVQFSLPSLFAFNFI